MGEVKATLDKRHTALLVQLPLLFLVGGGLDTPVNAVTTPVAKLQFVARFEKPVDVASRANDNST